MPSCIGAFSPRLAELPPVFSPGGTSHCEPLVSTWGMGVVTTRTCDAYALPLDRLDQGRGVVARGVALTRDDCVRGYAIERLLCDFRLDFAELRARFGADAEPVLEDAVAVALADEHGIARLLPGQLEITDRGRPFARTVAAGLDAYLQVGAARYSQAV